MFFMSLCILCIFGLGLASHVLYSIPKVRETIEKLLDI